MTNSNNGNTREKKLVGLFLMGCLLFNFPIISLFNLEKMFLGVPFLYLYMFFIWLIYIILIMFITTPNIRKPFHRSKNGEDQ